MRDAGSGEAGDATIKVRAALVRSRFTRSLLSSSSSDSSSGRERPRPARAGLAAGVGVTVRQDVALFAFAAAVLVVLLRARGRGERDGGYPTAAWRAHLRALVYPAAIVVGLALTWLASHGAAGYALEQVFLDAPGVGPPQATILGDALGLEVAGLGPLSGGVVAVLALLPLALALPLLWIHARRLWRGRADSTAALIAYLAVVVLLSANQSFRRDVLIRFLQGGPVVYLLWVAAAAQALALLEHRRLLRTTAQVGALVAGGVAPLLLVGFVWFAEDGRAQRIEYTGSPAIRFQEHAALEARGRTLFVEPSAAADLEALVGFVRARTRPDEPIFVLDRPAVLYFLTDRPNPTHRTRVGLNELDPFTRLRLGAEIRASGCRYVITTRAWLPRFQRFQKAYLATQARRVGDFGPYVVLELV